VQITLSLSLPRDELSVPVARRVMRASIGEVGVTAACIGAIEIALSEACTNVLKHSGPGDEYDITIDVDETNCTIRVIDTGHGFDFDSLGTGASDLTAERGRGVELMRALVDTVEFTSHPLAGTVVHLQKELEYGEGSLAMRLAARRDAKKGEN
jgi:serine/threonine-protein kinase RsbW